jgi:hypothetical protein
MRHHTVLSVARAMTISLLIAIQPSGRVIGAESLDEFESRQAMSDAHPLSNNATDLKGTASITVDVAKARIGQHLKVEALFRVSPQSPGGAVYNPLFYPLLKWPGAICLYDSNKKLAAEWEWQGGSRVKVDASAWVSVSAGSVVGSVQDIRIPAPGERLVATGPMTPGKYYLQVVYFNAFIGLSELDGRSTVVGPGDGEKLSERFDSHELFRSNAVELELIK